MSQRIQSLIPTVVRVLFGALFLISGINGLFQLSPMPPMEGNAATFIGGLAAAGYFFPLLKGIEILAGAALLLGRYVPLALTVLAPIVVNIALFHVVLVPGLPLVAFLLASEIYLAYRYRDAFAGVLRSDARPVVAPSHKSAPVGAAQRA